MPPATRDRGRRPRRGPENDSRARRIAEAQQAAYEVSRAVLAAAARERDEAWRQSARLNQRRAVLALASPLALALVLAVLGVVVAWALLAGLALAVVVGAASYAMWARSASWLAERLGGTALSPASAPAVLDGARIARLLDVTEGLCAVFGLRTAEVRVLADPAPNAISVGRSPDHGIVFVTTGLVLLLDRIELEAVVAHELAHLKRGDTVSGTIAVLAFGPLGRSLSVFARLTDVVAGAERESLADLAAVGVTKYPPGLISALEKIEAAPSRRPACVPRGLTDSTARLWLVPFEPGGTQAPRRGALDLAERIDALREL